MSFESFGNPLIHPDPTKEGLPQKEDTREDKKSGKIDELPENEETGEISESHSERAESEQTERLTKHYEELSDPEKFQEKMESQIKNAEMELAFAGVSFDARAEIGLATGKLGENIITKDVVEGARNLIGDIKGALKKIRNLDLKEVAKKGALGIKEFIKDNMLSLTPLLIAPLAIATGGDSEKAIAASIQLTGAMYSLDKVLDVVMDSAEEILPPQYVVALVAGTTNLPELGASQASAMVGDPISDVASTPLGSNPTNIYLTGFALMSAMKERAQKEGFIEEGEKLSFSVMKKTLKKLDWKSMKKQLGVSGMFAVDALLFQGLVRPEMKKGNFMPFAAWTAINIPVMAKYFYSNTFSKEAKTKTIIGWIKTDPKQIVRLREKILEEEPSGEGISPLLKMLEETEIYISEEEKKGEGKKNKKPRTEVHEKIMNTLGEIKTSLESNPELQSKVESWLKDADASQIESLLKFAKVPVSEKKSIDKKKLAKLIAGMGAIALLSAVLDAGATNMGTALPWLGKSAAGFVIMSFLTSVGEFMTSKKYFQRGRDEDAMKNITDSNAINIGLAKASVATSAVRGMFV